MSLAGSPKPTSRIASTVSALMRSKMRERQIPGLQIAVIHHGTIVMHGAYGTADLQHSVPVTDQTLFSIASITKAFAGVAIMQLVEEGKLSLDDPLSRYLPDVPSTWAAIPIHRLLTHTSGIPDIIDPRTGKLAGDSDPEAFISKANQLPMEFTPGERFRYNQTNYLLLSKIIEKVSGKPFTQFVTERQFTVAEMQHTCFAGFSDIVTNRAQPYGLRHHRINGSNIDTLANIFYESVPALVAGNGINTSAAQIANWIIALQHRQLLKTDASLTALWTPGVLNNGRHGGFGGALTGYALGWPIAERIEHPVYAPIGGNWAAVFVYPDDDLSIVILTNREGAHPETFIDEVAAYFVPGIANARGFLPPPAIAALETAATKQGFDHFATILEQPMYRALKSQLHESDVNAWGYRLMSQGQGSHALEVFKLNVALFPNSANTYDSLAETYAALGDHEQAVINYRQSLALDSHNDNAVRYLSH